MHFKRMKLQNLILTSLQTHAIVEERHGRGLFFMPENKSAENRPSLTQIHSGGGSRARKNHIGMYGMQTA